MRLFKTLFLPLLLLALWYWISASGLVSRYLLPGPERVLDSALSMASSGILLEHLAASFSRIAMGFSASIVVGLAAAGLLFRFRLLDELFSGTLSFLRMTPPLALAPLIILWLGIDGAMQVAIIMLASFFPIYLNTRAGLSRLDPLYRELAASLQVSRLRFLLFFLVPAAVPSIITGLRLSFGYSWRALIAAELIAASSGLGYLIMDAEQMQRADEVIVGIVLIGVIGWMLDAGFVRVSTALLGRRFPEIRG
ncbi:ABC transporter permease [Mailhella sp.]